MVPIVASILTGIAVNVGVRLATAVAKGVAESAAARSRAAPRASAGFKQILAEQTAGTTPPAATTPAPRRPRPAGSSAATVPPAEVISRLASSAHLYPIALDLAAGKGLPSPRRAAAAYRGVHPALT